MTDRRKTPRFELPTISNTVWTLPGEVLTKIAFYFPHWYHVENFMEALRPSHDLGPLEHVWQLHFGYNWKSFLLWPCLTLSRQRDQANVRTIHGEELIHLANIIKYYSHLMVDKTVDVDWICQNIAPRTTLSWSQYSNFPQANDLVKLKSLRITRFDQCVLDGNELVKALPSLPYLKEIGWLDLDASSAADVFKFAATSLSLQYLDVTRKKSIPRESWSITTSMAQDLVHWSLAHPVRVFRMHKFSWEHDADREAVLTSVLTNAALKSFSFSEYHHAMNFAFEAKYEKRVEELSLRFKFCRQINPRPNVDFVPNYINFFRHLIETRVKWLNIRAIENIGFEAAWTILKPILEKSKVTSIVITACNLSTARMNQMVDTISNMSTLQALFIGETACFDGLLALFHGVQPTVKRIFLDKDMVLDNEQWKTLYALADERSILLKRGYAY
ncbi:hypothetical protein Ae201684P_007153 [Aphanomyces euteiches]|nr:hypothetical protein Ae201684P_007153 [Aphanomyces euteiches]KAH9138301.1 hypothetical protein AeRB84_017368 [Aphanomyces euteiches]